MVHPVGATGGNLPHFSAWEVVQQEAAPAIRLGFREEIQVLARWQEQDRPQSLGSQDPGWAFETGAWIGGGKMAPGVLARTRGTRNGAQQNEEPLGNLSWPLPATTQEIFPGIILQNHDGFLTDVASCGKVGATVGSC